MRELPSRRVHEVWTQVIQDEELYEAVLAGTYRQLGRAFDDEALAILDWLNAEPGTRWNIENLRFRSTMFTGDILLLYMPRTIRMLTKGEDAWRLDLCYEYLAHHRWQALGHRQLSECERFAEFVRTRVMRRRPTPPHLEAAIAFELAAIRLLRSTHDIPADAWPAARALDDGALATARPRRAPAQVELELDVDLRPWIESGDPTAGELKAEPITLLLYMPALTERYRIKAISDGVRAILERCDGARSVRELAAELEAEYELPAAEVHKVVRMLFDERIVC